MKRSVRYERAKDSRLAYINIAEFFVTNVDLNENLVMDIQEYNSVLQEAM